jgi:hypothetical protein
MSSPSNFISHNKIIKVLISSHPRPGLFVTVRNINEVAHYQSFFLSCDVRHNIWVLEYEFYNECNILEIEPSPYSLSSPSIINRVVINEQNAQNDLWKTVLDSSHFESVKNLLKERNNAILTFNTNVPTSFYDTVKTRDGYLIQNKDAWFWHTECNFDENCLLWGCYFDTHGTSIEVHFKPKTPLITMFEVPPKNFH